MVESENVTLYSNGCPKCNVLKKKLDEAGVQYDVCAQESELLKMGIDKTPVLSVGENMYEFHDAVKWVESYNNAGHPATEENKSEDLDIKISLDRDFVSKFNSLRESYGDKFAKINGVANTQLNYTDFINNFIDQDTVANATIDPNANAHNKDVCSLMQEMNKSHLKIINYNKVYYELKKKYGLESADKWLALDYSGGTYLHDAASSSMMPYSYKGTETVVVKYNDDIKLVSFEMLYDIVDEEEVLLSERDNAYCKYTENLFVWDKDNSWAKVIRVIRKPKTEEFHFIRSENGISEIVTSNHPVITTNGDKEASKVTNSDKIISQPFGMCGFGQKDSVYCLEELFQHKNNLYIGETLVDKNTDKQTSRFVHYCNDDNLINNRIICDFDFGWLIGVVFSFGVIIPRSIHIVVNKDATFDNIIRILKDKEYTYRTKDKKNGYYDISIENQVLIDIIEKCFYKNKTSVDSRLSENILQYNERFIKGLITGMSGKCDELDKSNVNQISTLSRTLFNQIAFLIRMFGYDVKEEMPNDILYRLEFVADTNGENLDLFSCYNNVDENEILTEDDDKFVYDISVETGHFMCNNILSHNCYAYDLSDLATKGLFFIEGFKSKAANHLTTFCDHFLEYTSWVSNRSSGAAGFPNFLVWAYYFWRKDCSENFFLRSPEYYRDQCFQKVLFDLNQPYLRITQTTFSNFSIFDRIYCEDIFGGLVFPDDTCFIDEIEEFIEFQKAFIRKFKELRRENLFTYPVLTYALVYKDGKFKDEEFARWCSDSNMQWADSNFFINENTGTLSSCCLGAEEKVVVLIDGEVKTESIKNVFDEFNKTRSDHIFVWSGGSFSKATPVRYKEKQMYLIKAENGASVIATSDHLFPVLDEQRNRSIVKTEDLTTNHYLMFDPKINNDIEEKLYSKFVKPNTVNLWVKVALKNHYKITSVEKVDYDYKYVYCFEMADPTYPYFTLANGILTHNCRLLNDTTKLDAFINSIGGTALSIGSVKVNTINLMRIAYEAKDKEDYFNILRDRIDICIKTLDCVRHIIQRNVEKGLLPTYSHNLIDMSHQYCTIGINALYEATKYFGGIKTDEFGNNFYTEEGLKFASDVLDFINEVKDSYDLGYSINIESIPAERAAVCFAQKDNLLFNPCSEEYIYSNQWIALKDKATLQERVRVSSVLDKKCGGGVILHINIDAPFQNKEQAWKALNYVASNGVIYFAFNLRINLCEQNHSFTTKRCPICGGEPVETYQRIVGYLVPTHAYSSERKREFGDRYWLDGTDIG